MTVHPVVSCRGAERGKEREMKKYDESGSQKTTIQYNRTLPREGIVFHLKPSYIKSSFSPHIPILALLKRKTTFTHVAMQLVDTLRVDTDESRTLQLRRTKKNSERPYAATSNRPSAAHMVVYGVLRSMQAKSTPTIKVFNP